MGTRYNVPKQNVDAYGKDVWARGTQAARDMAARPDPKSPEVIDKVKPGERVMVQMYDGSEADGYVTANDGQGTVRVRVGEGPYQDEHEMSTRDIIQVLPREEQVESGDEATPEEKERAAKRGLKWVGGHNFEPVEKKPPKSDFEKKHGTIPQGTDRYGR